MICRFLIFFIHAKISICLFLEPDSAAGNTDDFLPSYEDVMANKQFYGIDDDDVFKFYI